MSRPSREGTSPSIRVMTFNLWGLEGDWDARHDLLKRGLRDLAPDLVAFQEAIVTDGYDQVRDLLPDGYEVIHQEGRSPDGMGNSIASRLPVGQEREAFLHVTPRVDPAHGWIGSIAAAEIQILESGGTLLFVHYKPSWQPEYDSERELQAVAAEAFIGAVRGGRDLPVVLLGDFDADPSSSSIRFWKGQEEIQGTRSQYVDAWDELHPGAEGHTFTPRNPLVANGDMPEETGRRIDYVFLSKGTTPGLVVSDCFLAFDNPVDAVWGSDHFGVVADLLPPM